MKTYRNINFTKRNYSCTNIVFCVAPNKEAIRNPVDWEECNPEDNTLDQLFLENGVRYFGYM